MPAFDIRPLDVHDEETSSTWYAAMHAAAVADLVAPLVVTEQALFLSLRRTDDDRYYDRHAFGAWVDGDCIGTAQVDLPRRDNTHLAEVEVAVVPAARRQGVGSALLARALEVAAERDVVSGEVHVPAGSTVLGFAERHGFTSKHTEDHLLLDLPVPAERLAALTSPVDGYRAIVWHGPVPERWLPHYARMQWLMQLDAPSGDTDRNAVTYDEDQIRVRQQRQLRQGYGLLSALVLTDDDEPAGYTDIFLMGDEAMQDDTFVLRAHRGHGLGTLAKLATLRELGATRRIHTWNAEVNGPMLAINHRFGYREVETTHTVERRG